MAVTATEVAKKPRVDLESVCAPPGEEKTVTLQHGGERFDPCRFTRRCNIP
jgi:hypothetical protein